MSVVVITVTVVGAVAQQSVSNGQDRPDTQRETVTVTSMPDGADVYLDQNFVGNTPATFKLQPGKYNVRVSLSGYHAWIRDLTAQPGAEIRLAANLEKNSPVTVRGRVLWNEKPMDAMQVYARECASAGPSQPRYGPAITDSQGRFSIAGVADGRLCLDINPTDG